MFLASELGPHDTTRQARRKFPDSNKSNFARFYLTSLITSDHAAFLTSFACKKLQDGCFAASKIDCLALECLVGFVFQIFDGISVEVTLEHNRIDVTLSTNCRSVFEYFGYLANCIFDVCFGLRLGLSGNRFGRLNARSDN
jgi:hypothetical protein